MKHQQYGFSVLELIISIMVSAMMMTAVLTIYNQISKAALTVQRITNTDTQLMILRDRLATDLQGLSPLWFTKETYEKLQKSKKDDSSSLQNQEPSLKNNTVNNFLYAQSLNDQFDVLTFITTNPLQQFSETQSRIVRVIYFLQPDKNQENTFKLMRKQEESISAELDLEKLKSGTFDQIVHNITHCKIEYGFVEQQQQETAKSGEPEGKSPQQTAKIPDKPPVFKFVTQWGKQNEDAQKNEKIPTLPDIVKLTMKIKSPSQQDAKTYELLCMIPTSQTTEIKSFAQIREEQSQKQTTGKESILATAPNNTTLPGVNQASGTGG